MRSCATASAAGCGRRCGFGGGGRRAWGTDYVLVGRRAALTLQFDRLVDDLRSGFAARSGGNDRNAGDRSTTMTDNKNFIIAIVLSIAVLIGWQYFFAGPQIEQPASSRSPKQPAKPPAAPRTSRRRRRSRRRPVDGAAPPAPSAPSRAGPHPRGGARPVAARADRDRRASPARSTSPAAGSTTSASTTSTRPSTRRARPSSSCRRPAGRTATSPSSAGSATTAGVAGARPGHACGRRRPGAELTVDAAGDAHLGQRRRPRLHAHDRGRRELHVHGHRRGRQHDRRRGRTSRPMAASPASASRSRPGLVHPA